MLSNTGPRKTAGVSFQKRLSPSVLLARGYFHSSIPSLHSPDAPDSWTASLRGHWPAKVFFPPRKTLSLRLPPRLLERAFSPSTPWQALFHLIDAGLDRPLVQKSAEGLTMLAIAMLNPDDAVHFQRCNAQRGATSIATLVGRPLLSPLRSRASRMRRVRLRR